MGDRRHLIPGRHWLVVAACVGLAALPESARERLRGRILDLTGRLSSRLAPDDLEPTPREQALEAQVALLEKEKLDLARFLDEAAVVAELTASRPELSLVPAEAFPLAGAQDLVRRLVLGRGERDGARKGAPVLAGAALVGLVAQVTRDRSEVTLLTDPTFRLRVTASRAGIDGVLSGNGGAVLTFSPAPAPDEDPGRLLQPGDALFVSRASSLCSVPAVVGFVREVLRVPGEATTRAVVVPAVPVARLARVVIVRNEEPFAVRVAPDAPARAGQASVLRPGARGARKPAARAPQPEDAAARPARPEPEAGSPPGEAPR